MLVKIIEETQVLKNMVFIRNLINILIFIRNLIIILLSYPNEVIRNVTNFQLRKQKYLILLKYKLLNSEEILKLYPVLKIC